MIIFGHSTIIEQILYALQHTIVWTFFFTFPILFPVGYIGNIRGAPNTGWAKKDF